jgi:hypothetical protein
MFHFCMCARARSHARFLCFQGFFGAGVGHGLRWLCLKGGVGYDEFAGSVSECGRVWFVCGG